MNEHIYITLLWLLNHLKNGLMFAFEDINKTEKFGHI